MANPLNRVPYQYRAATRHLLRAITAQVLASLTSPNPGLSPIAEKELARAAVLVADRLVTVGVQAARRAVIDAATRGRTDATRQTRGKPSVMPPGGVLERDRIADDLAYRLAPVHTQILRGTPDVYRRVIAEAMLGSPITGNAELDRLHRAQRALNRFADMGVVDFVDERGRRWNIVSYTEMATRTAATRAHVAAYTQRLQEAGLNLVVVSDHQGACPLCRPWEGRVLRISPERAPRTVRVRDADGRRYRTRVAGTLADAVAAGLMHPNCHHNVTAWTGPRTVVPRAAHDPDRYRDEQRLRAMERHVRSWRMREDAALTPATRAAAEARRKGWQQAIADHTARTGVARRRDREQITAAR